MMLLADHTPEDLRWGASFGGTAPMRRIATLVMEAPIEGCPKAARPILGSARSSVLGDPEHHLRFGASGIRTRSSPSSKAVHEGLEPGG